MAATLPLSRSSLKCPHAPPSPPASTPRGFECAPDSGAQASPRASQRREDFERWLLSARLEEEKKRGQGQRGQGRAGWGEAAECSALSPFSSPPPRRPARPDTSRPAPRSPPSFWSHASPPNGPFPGTATQATALHGKPAHCQNPLPHSAQAKQLSGRKPLTLRPWSLANARFADDSSPGPVSKRTSRSKCSRHDGVRDVLSGLPGGRRGETHRAD